MTVSALRDIQIIDVSVEDADPDRAAAIANTIGQVFYHHYQELESSRYAEPITNWEERISELSKILRLWNLRFELKVRQIHKGSRLLSPDQKRNFPICRPVTRVLSTI